MPRPVGALRRAQVSARGRRATSSGYAMFFAIVGESTRPKRLEDHADVAEQFALAQVRDVAAVDLDGASAAVVREHRRDPVRSLLVRRASEAGHLSSVGRANHS